MKPYELEPARFAMTGGKGAGNLLGPFCLEPMGNLDAPIYSPSGAVKGFGLNEAFYGRTSLMNWERISLPLAKV